MPGAKEWLLRADVLARALKVAFEPPSGRDMSEQDMAVRLSGCYGRVLMRASDVAAKRGTVSLTAFSVADPDTKAENAEARGGYRPIARLAGGRHVDHWNAGPGDGIQQH